MITNDSINSSIRGRNSLLEKTDVYIAHTPLHILLSYNHMKSEPDQNNFLLFVIHDFLNAPSVAKGLIEFSRQSHQVELLPGYFGIDRFLGRSFRNSSIFVKLRRHFAALRTIRLARSIYWTKNIDRVFVFSDIRGEIQVMMNDLAVRQSSKIFYLDDGFAPYRINPEPVRNKLQSIVYGQAWYPTRSYGEHPLIDGAYLLYPEFAHPSLREKDIQRMPDFCLDEIDLKLLTEAFSPDERLWNELSNEQSVILLCLPHSELVIDHGAIRRWIHEIADSSTSLGIPVLAKYHPREFEPDYLFVDGLDIRSVDRSIPAELICSFLGKRLHAIYAEASSVVITIPWINEDAKVFLIKSGTKLNLQELNQVLQASGVKIVEV